MKDKIYFWYHDMNGEGGWYFGNPGDGEWEFLKLKEYVGPFDSYKQALSEYKRIEKPKEDLGVETRDTAVGLKWRRNETRKS